MYNKMDDKSIDKKREVGDWRLVARKMGKTIDACRQAYYRKEGKAYEDVRKVLIEVIEFRERFLEQE